MAGSRTAMTAGTSPAQFSGRVKTTHGDAMPRSACVPSAIRRVDISPEKLAKMQSGAERQRRQSLPKPLLIEMCHADARGGDRAQCGIAGAARRSSDHRKDRQYAVADEFQHLAAERVNRAGDTIKPGVER